MDEVSITKVLVKHVEEMWEVRKGNRIVGRFELESEAKACRKYLHENPESELDLLVPDAPA